MKWFKKKDSNIRNRCRLLPELEGAVISAILVNVVDPEFNIVYIDTDIGSYSIHGESGGEYLGVRKINSMPGQITDEGYRICPYQPFERFVGRKIAAVHQIGKIWKGHGFELCFEKMPNETMIVQSIYAGDKPEDFEDCLRLGIGSYQFEYENP